MGELSGNGGGFTQGEKLTGDHAVTTPKAPDGAEPQGVKTDVDGVYAHGEKNGVPVFDVSSKEFYRNMKQDRKRLRFQGGTPAADYHRNSKYRRPFYVRNKEDGYMFKVK